MMENDCEYKISRKSLTEAYDDKTNQCLSWETAKRIQDQEGYFLIKCPKCSEKVMIINGEKRNGFFRHFHTGERKQTEGRRNTEGGTSVWHHRWQMCFPEHKEKQLNRGEDRADVLFTEKRIAIEFQKSDFSGTSCDTCQKRTAYWNSKGYKIIWVFAWDGGSGFSGYFPRGTGRDGDSETCMELAEYNKLFGAHRVRRENVEIHFLSLDGAFGFEFIPTAIIEYKQIVRGHSIPSYLQPFAPAYNSEMKHAKVKESHLLEPVVKPVTIDDFFEAMQRANSQKTFTLYELLQTANKLNIEVLGVERLTADHYTRNAEIKIHPQQYNTQTPSFQVRGKIKRQGFKSYTDEIDISYCDQRIWRPLYGYDIHNKYYDSIILSMQ